MTISPLTLLHLSDTQFGRHHRFGAASDEALDSLLTRLVDDLEVLRKDHDLKPQVVLLTGDLSEWGKQSEFDDVLKFAIGLSERLSIPRRHFVTIPGNHDINRKLCEAYFNTCEAEDAEPKKPYWDMWRFYNKFFQGFYQEETDSHFTEAEPWTLFEMPDLKIVVAGLNSTIQESHRDEDHYGWLGEEQLRWFAKRLGDYQQSGWFRIAALHHNLRRGPVNDDENLRDLEDFEKYLGGKVNLIVHGHTHDGKADWSINKVPILATGSAAVKAEQRPEEIPNQYQIIQLWPDRYQRWARCYFPKKNTWGGDNRASNSLNTWQAGQSVSFADVQETFPLLENTSDDADSIQRQQKLRNAGRGLEALRELMETPKVRRVVERFSYIIEKTSRDFQVLSDYKSMHDVLHDIQFSCYDPITAEARYTKSNEKTLNHLKPYYPIFLSILDNLHQIQVHADIDKLWIRQLESVGSLLQEYFDKRDIQYRDKAIIILRQVLERRPSQINRRLNEKANEVDLSTLYQNLSFLGDQMDDPTLDPKKVRQFKNGIIGLVDVSERLKAAIFYHGRWQAFDDELRMADSSITADDTSQLVMCWEQLESIVCELEPHITGEKRKSNFQSVRRELAEALNRNDAQEIRSNYDSYRNQAALIFHTVDRDLKTLCSEMLSLGKPLVEIIKVIES